MAQISYPAHYFIMALSHAKFDKNWNELQKKKKKVKCFEFKEYSNRLSYIFTYIYVP